MQLVGAYLFKGRIFLNPSVQTTAGIWIGTEYVTVNLETDEPLVKGEALVQALLKSYVGIPHPRSFEELGKELLVAAGVRKWQAFSTKSAYCSITRNGGAVELLPHRHFGRKGAYTPIPERQIKIEIASPINLGRALEDCLRISVEAEPQSEN